MSRKIAMKQMGMPLEGAGFLSDLLPGPLGQIAGMFGLGVEGGAAPIGPKRAPKAYALFVKAHKDLLKGNPREGMKKIAALWKAEKAKK